MRNFTKLSFITVLALATLSTSSLASDNLKDAFANGKFKGELKSFYFARTYDGTNSTNDTSIFVNGGNLNYVTDSLLGFTLGATLQTSHVTNEDENSVKYNKDMDASGSRLSESYIKYSFGKSAIKAGRQFISTPLIKGSGSRMVKQSFEAYTFTSTLAKTKIFASYITKFQHRTDRSLAGDTAIGDIANFRKNDVGNDGTMTIYLNNNSIKGLNLKAQYYDKSEKSDNSKDSIQNLFLQAQYKFGGDLKPYLAAQYYDTSYEASAKKDNDLIGFKAGLNIKGFNIFAGYTKTGESNSAVAHGIGTGSWAQFTASPAYGGENAFAPETKSTQFGLAKKFGNLKTKIRFTSYDVKNNGINIKQSSLKETAINLKYFFTGSLKNLMFGLDYSILDSDLNNQHDSELRTRLIYKF